jgi:hypothetical protein
VARLELVRLDDVVDVVDRLEVEVELVWLVLELRAFEISCNAVFRSVNPWLNAEDWDEDEEMPDVAEAAAGEDDDDVSAEAPTLCSEVSRDSTEDEN